MPVHHLEHVLLPLLEKMGWSAEVVVEREGFFPKGGARVRVDSKPARLHPLTLEEPGRLVSIQGISIAHRSLERARVAHRQAKAAADRLRDSLGVEPAIEVDYVDAFCPGSGIQLWATTEQSRLGGNSLGERGIKSETVGAQAAEALIEALEGGAVDFHTADQLLPYLALAGGGDYTTGSITDHVTTNAYVIEQFLDVRIEASDGRIRCRSVS
jgi:RNA 3'-phosphate cyclase